MSEHHRVAGGWANANPGNREDGNNAGQGATAWWPAGLNEQAAQAAAQQQAAHQQAAAQQQAQQQAAAQHQAAAVAAAQQQHQQNLQQHLLNQQQQLSQHHQEQLARSTAAAAATQQLFSYKMASSFQNPATTGAQSSPVSSSSPVACMKGYDYRTGVPVSAQSAPPGVQWWYSSQVMEQQNNLHQQQLQQGQHLASITTQTSTPPIISPHQIQQLHHQNNLQQNNAGLQQKAKSTKPRGRMTAYAFFVQTCRQEHKKKHPDENIVFQEFSKKCALRWKTMSDKEKKRFHEMAEKDKKRYDTEMQSYIPPKGEKLTGRGKKRKHIKDPNAPKRSLSAFFWFCNDERGKVKMINPEYGVGDIAKELGKRWSDAGPELKGKYEAMAEKDKARYEREMTAYKKKMKDGPGVGAPAVAKKAESEGEEWEDEDE